MIRWRGRGDFFSWRTQIFVSCGHPSKPLAFSNRRARADPLLQHPQSAAADAIRSRRNNATLRHPTPNSNTSTSTSAERQTPNAKCEAPGEWQRSRPQDDRHQACETDLIRRQFIRHRVMRRPITGLGFGDRDKFDVQGPAGIVGNSRAMLLGGS